jgi:hypothetical protein
VTGQERYSPPGKYGDDLQVEAHAMQGAGGRGLLSPGSAVAET